jgi:hypothetical protein
MARDPNALIGRRKPEAEREVARACGLFHAKAQRREEDKISHKDTKRARAHADCSLSPQAAIKALRAIMALRLLASSALFVSLCEIPFFSLLCTFAPLRAIFLRRAHGADLP